LSFKSHQENADDELILEIQNGNDTAFETIYKRYEGKLMGYLVFKLKNQELAEEIFQLIWSKVLKNIHKYRFTESFSSWLFTIASNSVKDWYKKSSNEKKLLESFRQVKESTVEAGSAQIDLKFLKPDFKKVIELQYIEGLSSKEISKELNLSESNVRKISSRAKQTIKEHILNGGSLS